MEQCLMIKKGRAWCLVGSGTELQSSSWENGKCQSQVLCRDLVLLLASKNLPKKFVAFPPMNMSILCQKCLWPRTLQMAGRAVCLSRERAAAFQTFRINFGLFFFFNLKLSFVIPHSWHYRISYLSTTKVVSVENLTGLFPSTWVTLVTCGDNTHSVEHLPPLPNAAKHSFPTLTISKRTESTQHLWTRQYCKKDLKDLCPAPQTQPDSLRKATAQSASIPSKRSSTPWPYLYVAIVLFGDEGDLHWKEVIWLPCYAELQAATLVFGIYHRQAPLQEISPAVMAILAIYFPNHWGTDTRPTAGKKELRCLTRTELRNWTNPKGKGADNIQRHLLALPRHGTLLTVKGLWWSHRSVLGSPLATRIQC